MRKITISLASVVFVLAACGGRGGGGGGGGGSCTAGPTASLAVTATGLSPVNVCVQPGGSVTFTNSDPGASHDIVFDTPGCPTVGSIAAGGGQVTAAFPSVMTCVFHDASAPAATAAAFRGSVTVAPPTMTVFY